LQSGERAALVSAYGGGGITKRIVRESDAEGWEGLPEKDAVLSFTDDGGSLSLIEYYAPKPRLLILGGGHIALALSAMGAMLDFHVVVFDDRPVFANRERFPGAHTVICDSFANVMERLRIRRSDYVIIVTRGHQHDTLCLKGVLDGELPYYTGMIGSARRTGIVKKQLADEGYPPDDIAGVYSPIGLRIGAVTPEEISVSIMAEIIQHKRKGPADPAQRRHSWARGMFSSDVELVEWLANGENRADALITVVAAAGSTPREAGAKMAVTYEGDAVGTVGGGCAEAGVLQSARAVIRKGAYSLETIDLTDSAGEDGMVCGGTMTMLIESL
jgi:xanthine dehydrogenase accessory factor